MGHLKTTIKTIQSSLPSPCNYSGWAKGGSYYNHLSVRGKRPDFDLLILMLSVRLSPDQLDALFANEQGIPLTCLRKPLWYLQLLHQCALKFSRLGTANRQEIDIKPPSVTMCTADTEFDLLPALKVHDAEDKCVPGLYLIPADNDRWKFSFTEREKSRLKQLNQQLPCLRDALKIMKYLNQTQQWGLPSFAFTCLAWHASEQLIIYKWPRSPVSVSWEKVKVLHALLVTALEDGRIMHMFFPRDNLLSSLSSADYNHVFNKVRSCAI